MGYGGSTVNTLLPCDADADMELRGVFLISLALGIVVKRNTEQITGIEARSPDQETPLLASAS